MIITARANKNLAEAWIESGDNLISLYTENNYIKDEITFTTSCNITLLCEDRDKIKNINPPLNKINVIKDTPPQIFVSTPESEFSINDNRLVGIDMQTIDDYGIADIWIEYKIIKPSYLGQDSSIYKHSIDNIDPTEKAQRLIHDWDISSHFLAPDDKIEFYILVADNNNVTGPSIGKAGPFIGKVPSLDDLFEDISNLENEVIDEIEEITLSVDDVYELVDELEKDLLKSEEVTWEQEKKISESSEKIDEILNDIENITEMLEQIQEEAENNDLFNQDLIEKFNEFQELLNMINEEKTKINSTTSIAVKIAPDIKIKDLDVIGNILLKNDVKFVIISNTSDGTRDDLKNINKFEKGGLSGKPIEEKSNLLINEFYKIFKNKIKIIGVGGVDSGRSAYEKFISGASYIQLYTGMVYQGPNIVNNISEELNDILSSDGVKNIEEIVGSK
mgnify:CR=1 FL=1